MSLKSIIENHDTGYGRTFDLVVQGLIVFSLVTLSIETLPNLSEETNAWLRVSEIIVVVFFTIEYALRIIVADKKISFIFSFYGIIDFLAIAPFYLALGVDLRSLRSFRLLRVFRLIKLTRYSQAMMRLHRAFFMVKEELILFSFMVLILLYLSALGIYFFENEAQPEAFKSVFHSLWWAVATLTTVGYGDVYPITMGGRTFTFFVLMIGLGIIAVPAGMVASALSTARSEELEKDDE